MLVASKTGQKLRCTEGSFPYWVLALLFSIVLVFFLLSTARASEPAWKTTRSPDEIFNEHVDIPILRPLEFQEKDDLVIRGQSPRILSQIVPLAQQLFPSRLWEIGDEVFSLGNQLLHTGQFLRSGLNASLNRRAGRFRSEYAYDSDGLKRIGGNLMLSSALPIAVDSEFYYREVPVATGGINELWNGDLNLIYNIDAHPRYKFRTGAGINWKTDNGSKTDIGFNTSYALEFILKGPWIVSASIDWGRLADDALFRWRVTGSVVMGSWELFTGYEDYKVGNDRFNGILGGAGFWF